MSQFSPLKQNQLGGDGAVKHLLREVNLGEREGASHKTEKCKAGDAQRGKRGEISLSQRGLITLSFLSFLRLQVCQVFKKRHGGHVDLVCEVLFVEERRRKKERKR